jgi:hypothetical protein
MRLFILDLNVVNKLSKCASIKANRDDDDDYTTQSIESAPNSPNDEPH